MSWISVKKDGLPNDYINFENDASFLTYPHYRVLPFGTSECELEKCEFWYYDEALDCVRIKHGVTHWMPLPEPPKEGQ